MICFNTPCVLRQQKSWPTVARIQFQITYTNRAFKHWAEIFNHDTTLTSALLDRVLHHAETVVIEGRSYRIKDQIDPDPAA